MGEILIVNKQNEKNFAVDLYVRSWIEIFKGTILFQRKGVDLYVRSWIEISICRYHVAHRLVDLYVRSWIEINVKSYSGCAAWVDLYVRSWIEICLIEKGARPLCVDLYVRSWIEIILMQPIEILFYVDLYVGSWIEMLEWSRISTTSGSTSMWGRELKYRDAGSCWWSDRRPLCEVVNWNIRKYDQIVILDRRPLCEVVNWNISFLRCASSSSSVDLYVRSWIEIDMFTASSCISCVDLYVRSWIEIISDAWSIVILWSTSMWGRELKFPIREVTKFVVCRPLHEVVNWNIAAILRRT